MLPDEVGDRPAPSTPDLRFGDAAAAGTKDACRWSERDAIRCSEFAQDGQAPGSIGLRGGSGSVVPTALAADVLPASADAVCLAGVLAAGAPIVGKTNLYELGVNPHFGTPVNPFDRP